MRMDASLYASESKGRRPLFIVLFAIGAALLAFGILGGAPWIWYLPVGFFALVSGWQLVANPVSGARLTASSLLLHSGRWRREVDVAVIEKLSITAWSDGPPSLRLILRDGSDEPIPHMCIERRDEFLAALATLGVPIERT